jgi:hypothetical protein
LTPSFSSAVSPRSPGATVPCPPPPASQALRSLSRLNSIHQSVSQVSEPPMRTRGPLAPPCPAAFPDPPAAGQPARARPHTTARVAAFRAPAMPLEQDRTPSISGCAVSCDDTRRHTCLREHSVSLFTHICTHTSPSKPSGYSPGAAPTPHWTGGWYVSLRSSLHAHPHTRATIHTVHQRSHPTPTHSPPIPHPFPTQ